MDLKNAFSQVPIAKECRPINTCSTPIGQFVWNVVPQGLKNAPAIFQRLMDSILAPVREYADAYFDDIIVGTDTIGMTEEEGLKRHNEDLRKVLDTLAEQKLVLDGSKAQLFVRSVEFCGHILEGGTRRPSPGKLKCLEGWELPKTVTALRAFLGFTNYYHSYVPQYAEYASLLSDKLKLSREDGKKGSQKKLEYTPEEVQSFSALKELLVSGLEVQIPDPDKPFILRVDASRYAVGAVLEQMPNGSSDPPSVEAALEGKTRPVGFFFKKNDSRAKKDLEHKGAGNLCIGIRFGKVGINHRSPAGAHFK